MSILWEDLRNISAEKYQGKSYSVLEGVSVQLSGHGWLRTREILAAQLEKSTVRCPGIEATRQLAQYPFQQASKGTPLTGENVAVILDLGKDFRMFNLFRARAKNIVSAGLLTVGYLTVPVMGQASTSGIGPQKTDGSVSFGELPPLLSLRGHGGWGDSNGNKGSYRSSLDIVRDGSGVLMTSEYEGSGFNQNFSVKLEPVGTGFLIKMDGETIGTGECQGGQQCTLRYDGEQAVTETLFLQGNQWLRFGQKTVGGARIFWFEVL